MYRKRSSSAMASGSIHERRIQSLDLHDNQHMSIEWEDATCPVCLEFPHNGVLLYCSSYDKGCRPFICDTGHNQSNCLDRFKAAHKVPGTIPKVFPSLNDPPGEGIQAISPDPESCPTCPLCRGAVTGWIVIDEARASLNSKKRCCEERECTFVGNYAELQAHARENHPDARPSEVDPARRLDWENFQQSSEIIDVLSTIHSEVPNGVVLGDYVIEYGDESGDEYEDFPGDEGNWWTSCILYQVFDNFRSSRSRRRTRADEFRRRQQRAAHDASNADDGSVSPPNLDFAEFGVDDSDDEFVTPGGSVDSASSSTRVGSTHRSYRRRRPRLHEP